METPTSSVALVALPPYDSTPSSRLQSLYSDISRQKHSNPTSYNANIEWWRKALESVVRSGIQQQGSKLVLGVGPALMDLLRMPGVGKPLALAAAVNELRAQKVLLTQSEFLDFKESIYNPGWLPGRIAAYVVGKPLWWALEQLGIVGEEGFISTAQDDKGTTWWGDYVVVPLLEAATDKVLAKQLRQPDALYSLESFKLEFSSALSGFDALPDREARLLLRFLERDRRAVIVQQDIIKFIDPRSTVREITAVDRSILELKEAVRHLRAQVSDLQRSIDEYTKKASTALQQKHKPVALAYLRSRKQVEDLLRKRLGTLETLEATLISVETAAGDVELMKTYESSTATLRTILSHPSLQKDSIEKTMDALAEANADAKEVDEAIRIGGDVALGIDAAIDDADIEEELAKLARESEAEDMAGRLGDFTLHTPSQVPEPEQVERKASPLLV
ncbi:Snf7-domain-containing protein [Roridomyces roridus]|uniref:Snf7-domain-containing protein n=1 Tax=Roridomyces roridus TaxID=1738132 RepID=A0AAD7BWT8_9AGAR|nr:Snf7-domain-containing protein [Roridomyces roridus]